MEILTIALDSKELINEYEDTIEKMEGHAREYANEIADLSHALEEEQDRRATLEETHSSLEESYNLNVYKLRKDIALALANDLKTKNDELVVGNARLLEDHEKLEKEFKSLESSLTKLTKSHDQLQAQMIKDLTNPYIPCP